MKYKVIKIYIVEASNKKEAIEKVQKDPNTLETTIVKEADYSGGWGAQIKKQFGL